MVDFEQEDRVLALHYTTDRGDSSWVDERFEEHETVRIYKTFFFKIADLLPAPEYDGYDTRVFTLGVVDGEYYRISGRILGLRHDLYLQKGMTINEKTFSIQGTSIFGKIDDLIDEEIVVGGERENAIPLADFRHLQKNFPTPTELKHYAGTRISGILSDYFDTMTDAKVRLERYLERREPINRPAGATAILQEYEIEKWVFVRNEVESMLGSPNTYTEKQWQTKMLEFILLLFPKYVAALENVQVKDYYSAARTTNRYIDLTLVDADGHIDAIEIKKPFPKALLSTATYRDNYIPRKELSGTIMQVEKYLFHLNKWGVVGEKVLNNRYSADLPAGLQIKVVNPKALVILGRDNNFSAQETFDFEIIRRKYANLMDIITYDDLLRRLDNIIAQLR